MDAKADEKPIGQIIHYYSHVKGNRSASKSREKLESTIRFSASNSESRQLFFTLIDFDAQFFPFPT